MISQSQNATRLRELHHTGKLLVLPNIWDCLGARLLQSMDFAAVATASASIAFSNGYRDGEHIPFEKALEILNAICQTVDIPVTADIECGYASNRAELEEHIKKFLETGIAGINIEDTNRETGKLNSIEEQCERIQVIKRTAEAKDVPLFINARTDVFLQGDVFPRYENKIGEITNRGLAYKEAGADCFYPIALRKQTDIEELVKTLSMPINILTIPGIPGLKKLEDIGVARLSLGPSFMKFAVKSMQQLASDLKNYDGLEAITSNPVTTDFLNDLMNSQK